jgi:dihydroorotate dehydrogenase
MFKIARYFLFMMSAEKAHYVTLNLVSTCLKIPVIGHIMRLSWKNPHPNPVNFIGIQFPNRIGLAAGFDKNAKYLEVMKAFGFGHVEIGTVTPLPQSGNELPRLFRLIKDEAIINRMGFNNDGVKAIVERLKNRPEGLIIGGNIGKNKVTSNEDAINDYKICFTELYPYVDYFTVNVSSPNTPGLRALQDKEPLTAILNALLAIRKDFTGNGFKKLPVLLKIAPDLETEQLDDIVELTLTTGIDGIVATNTTISREGLKTEAHEVEKIGAGGLSGKPLMDKSTQVLKYLNMKFEGKVPMIGVGGIYSAGDAATKFMNGAGLVQIYSGFIYEGPALVRKIG